MPDMSRQDRMPKNPQEYDLFLELENLESLLEEIEESGDVGQLPSDPEARKRLAELGLSSVSDLRKRIAELHAELDAL
jgi:hypothetical protein